MKALFTTIVLGLILNSNALYAEIIDHPKASLTLHFEQKSGTNASSVTFNPKTNLYYAAFAGNSSYPLEVFDIEGKNIYQTSTGVDIRGLWWNKKSKSLEANCYSDGGIVSFPLNKQGFPSIGAQTLFEGVDHQPSANSCGVYDSKKKQTLYYKFGNIYKYAKGNKVSTLNLPIKNKDNINAQCMIYTGKKSMEIGLLDYVNKEVYLYNSKTGKKTAKITLPSDAITYSAFRFAFANNYVFLYDSDSRNWVGYQILN